MVRHRELPSFSIIVETENLSQADLSRLAESLQSVANQDLPIGYALDVVVQDSGFVPAEDLAMLQQRFPWISFHRISKETGHYEAKMELIDAVNGEVIVYSDCDCIYEPSWLRHLLLPFSQYEDTRLVGGETQMPASSPFGLAMLLTHVFSPYSWRAGLYASDSYYANNVAFRREFLRDHRIPSQLPIYRGNCVIHARALAACDVTIWRQPQSRAVHALPETFGHFFSRFLRMGEDALQVSRLSSDAGRGGLLGLLLGGGGVIFGKFHETFTRGYVQWNRSPRRLDHFVFAIPVIAAAHTLFMIGVLRQALRPTSFRRDMDESKEPVSVVGSPGSQR